MPFSLTPLPNYAKENEKKMMQSITKCLSELLMESAFKGGGATILTSKEFASHRFYSVYCVPEDAENISFIKKCLDSAA